MSQNATSETTEEAAEPSRPAPRPATDYDAVVIGGAFAGSSFATLLRRWCPESRVLVVEREAAFARKVGEATVEVTGFFLHRMLGLHDHLAREHLPKHGLRYWFSDGPERRLTEMSEAGPKTVPPLPAFQLDRSRLDEHVLATAADEGVEVLRPAKVLEVEHGWPVSRVRLETAEGEREVSTRWVIDASGRHAFLARRLRLHERFEGHPTAAAWARWEGVADLDGRGVLGRDLRSPALPGIESSRRLATNHFCGYGYWCWVIPLAGGQTSVGVVYDKQLFELPGEGTARERYRRFVTSLPGLGELLADARMDEDDCHAYSHLPYRTTRYAAPGWALVGDAAGFLDPYYSPGLDHVSISVFATARLVEDDLLGRLEGEALDAAVATHDEQFLRSYERWIRALYVGKYEILGDAELTVAAFLLDTALYYLGVVTPVYRQPESLRNPVFGLSLPQAKWAFKTMAFLNRRLTRLARFRRQVGTYGRRNVGWRFFSKAPGLGSQAFGMLRQGLWLWLRLELEYLGHRLRGRKVELSHPVARPLGPEAAS